MTATKSPNSSTRPNSPPPKGDSFVYADEKAQHRLLHRLHEALPGGEQETRKATVPGAVLSVCASRRGSEGDRRAGAVHERAQSSPAAGPDVHADPGGQRVNQRSGPRALKTVRPHSKTVCNQSSQKAQVHEVRQVPFPDRIQKTCEVKQKMEVRQAS